MRQFYAHSHPIEGEQWRSVVGYEGLYEVSDHGRVRRLGRRASKRGGATVLAACHSRRYVCVCLCAANVSHTVNVHRLVASAFIANPDQRPEVNHKDGNKHNNRADNLEWVTKAENEAHAMLTGLKAIVRGSQNGQSLLNEETVLEARRRYARKETTLTAMAKEYGVSVPCLSEAVSGKHKWRHVL